MCLITGPHDYSAHHPNNLDMHSIEDAGNLQVKFRPYECATCDKRFHYLYSSQGFIVNFQFSLLTHKITAFVVLNLIQASHHSL